MSDRVPRLVDQFDAAEPEPDELPATLDIEIDVEFMKKRFATLHIREPKAKEMEKAERELNVQGNPTPYNFRRYQCALLAAVAQVPVEVIGELPNSTVRRAWDFLAKILDRDTREIGET
jgi:hypothetical protein